MAEHLNRGRSLHDQLIAGILSDWPTARERGFMKALKALPDAEYVEYLNENEPDWQKGCRVVPDAYLIDTEKRHVILFEAVVHNDIDTVKFARINSLAWLLDEDYYTLGLIRCTRFGRTAYAPLQMTEVSDIELVGVPRKNSFRIPDWQKYTTGYCSNFYAEITRLQDIGQ